MEIPLLNIDQVPQGRGISIRGAPDPKNKAKKIQLIVSIRVGKKNKSSKRCALTLARPRIKIEHIVNTTTGTTYVGAETLITSAESAKKVLVTGLFFANAFV
jgi:hypothetical protein